MALYILIFTFLESRREDKLPLQTDEIIIINGSTAILLGLDKFLKFVYPIDNQ
jgi:hypothetical protein